MNYLQAFPRLALEGVAVVAVILIFVIVGRGGTDANGVTLAVMYVAAAYRLIPSANRLIVSGLMIAYALPVVRSAAPSLLSAVTVDNQIASGAALAHCNSLALKDASFRYPEAERATLDVVSLNIGKGDVVGLIGNSGAGKTTLLGLLGGLLSPTAGTVALNGQPVTGVRELTSLRACIAYVPQNVFIADDTVRANIALGEAQEDIDTARLDAAIEAACLSETMAGLASGLDTQIGERGARLSGGQAQRIGIARALYLRRPLLILDEATSALDTSTEREVLKAIGTLGAVSAIFMVTHRMAALATCTRAYRIDNGKLSPVDPSTVATSP